MWDRCCTTEYGLWILTSLKKQMVKHQWLPHDDYESDVSAAHIDPQVLERGSRVLHWAYEE